jgi:hypothetical protein
VRHSVMLLGPGGCAKTAIWKTLAGTFNLDKPKKTCVCEVVNPKSVTGNELYGYMTLSKDWKDGVLSIIMRGMAKNFPDQGFYDYQSMKWVVLDGDIDAVWIESMNTVMDDNKVGSVAAYLLLVDSFVLYLPPALPPSQHSNTPTSANTRPRFTTPPRCSPSCRTSACR